MVGQGLDCIVYYIAVFCMMEAKVFRAQSTVEYLLMMAAIIGAVILAASAFSSNMASNYEKIAGHLDNVSP